MNTFNEDHPEIVPALRREWMILARRRWMIVTIVILAVLGAAAYNYSVKPLFAGGAIVSAGETIPGQPYARLNADVPRLKSVLDREIARITSRELASRIIKGMGERERAELALGPLGPWYRRLIFSDPPAVSGVLSTAQAVTALRSRLQVSWREPSTWVDIRVVGFDPEAVANLANALAVEYVAETEEANRKTIEEATTSTDIQVRSKEKQLGEQLSGLRDMGTETGLGDFNARKAILERQIRGFQEALIAAQTARVGRAATGREAAQMDGASANDARVIAAQNRVAELEDREKSLLATLGEQHPDVISAQEQLKNARARLEAATTAIATAATSAYELALKEEARIEENLNRVQRDLSALESRSLPYALTQKRADASRIAVEQMIQRQELQVPIVIEAEIIQSAAPSPVPTFPQKRQNFTYALVGGLLAGILLAWLIERFDDTIQSPDDVRIVGLPFLGVVPRVARLAGQPIQKAIADTRTGFADSLRVVRTNLMYSAPQIKPKVLVFTSASPGDGKSTVASAVALLLQETQAKVLLIDGDLRRPSIHTLLDVSTSPGLSDLLAMESPVLSVSRGPTTGVDVLAAGPPLVVSAARLGSDNMRSLLKQARERYDWVIIDSPPSLGLPDASVLATLADAVVVVCSGDKTPRQALNSVGEQLRAVGAHVLGVVLNRVDMNRHSYYYGRYYSAYYGHDEKPKPTPVAATSQAE